MNDPRILDLIQRKSDPGIDLIGFPSDEGVTRNGGRPGAAEAPSLIAEAFYKLTPHPQFEEIHSQIISTARKLELLPKTGSMEEHQEALGKRGSQSLQEGRLPVIIGGGHETAYGHFLAYTRVSEPLQIVNIDAHADVRPFKNGKAHSGSPFRQAREHQSKKVNGYHVLGINPASCARDHLDYVLEKGSFCFDMELNKNKLEQKLNSISDSVIMATMDMDAVNRAQAPGVSAPNAGGISSRLWLDLAFLLGKHPRVSSLDISEVNPRYDQDQATIRLAALTIWYFSLGFALRSQK
ncbi:MAG: arginase [Bacteroidetes bacterium]|jgi:formiminoglutamase|nr:arginase [Bacteroidota bacterium]